MKLRFLKGGSQPSVSYTNWYRSLHNSFEVTGAFKDCIAVSVLPERKTSQVSEVVV